MGIIKSYNVSPQYIKELEYIIQMLTRMLLK